MADRDPKQRVGTDTTAPASQPVKHAPADSSSTSHHAAVVARINRGHGKSMGDNPNLVPFSPHGE